MRAGIIIYGFALAIAAVVMVLRREPALEWVAARELPVGQMLTSGDAVPAGRQYYVKHAMKKGQGISADDIAALPEFFGRENEIAFSVTVARSQVGRTGVSIGDNARLCKEGKPLEPVVVRLVVCATEPGNCLGVVAIPSTRASELASFFDKGPLPYLQPMKTTPACK